MTPLKSTDTAALNSAFAEKVAAFVWVNNWVNSGRFLKHPDVEFMHNPVDMSLKPCDDYDRLVPDFCHSADAVLKFIEQWPMTTIQLCPGAGRPWLVDILKEGGKAEESEYFHGQADHLAAAICIALLRSKGIQVEDGA